MTGGDAHHLGVGVASGKLYLRDDGCPLLLELEDDGGVIGYAGAFHHLVGVEHQGLGVRVSLLPGDVVAVQQLLVLGLDGAHVAHEGVEALHLCQHGGTRAALAGTQYYDSFHISIVSFQFRLLCIVSLLLLRRPAVTLANVPYKAFWRGWSRVSVTLGQEYLLPLPVPHE